MFGSKTIPIFNLDVPHTSKGRSSRCPTLLLLFFYRRAVLLFSSIFSSKILSAGSELELETFWLNSVNSVLSPPAVDEASVTKLASQKSLQFLNSSFSEYYIYTICI